MGHDPCSDGVEALSSCATRADVYAVAAHPMYYDFLYRSMVEGWGPTPADIHKTFRPYINGARSAKYKTKERTILSQIWCRSDRVDVPEDVRVVLLFGCHGTITVKPWQVVKIVVDPESRVAIVGASSSLVYIENYGGHVEDVSGITKIKNIEH